MYVVHGSALPRGNKVNARMQAIDVGDRIGSRILYPAALSAMLRGMKAQNRCGLPGQNDQLIIAAVRRQSYNVVGIPFALKSGCSIPIGTIRCCTTVRYMQKITSYQFHL